MRGTSSRPGVVMDPPKAPSRRQTGVKHKPAIVALAQDAALQASGKKSLFFCQSRALAEAVAEPMRRGTTVYVHHSSVSPEHAAAGAEEHLHGRIMQAARGDRAPPVTSSPSRRTSRRC